MTAVAKLEAILSADTRAFDQALDHAHQRTHKFGTAMKVAAGAAIGGIGLLAVGLEKSARAAVEAQVSTARLDQAFKNAGLSSAKYADAVEKSEAAGRKLGFTDEDTKTALGSLLTATKNYGTAVKDLSVAQDVARFKHIDLADASKMLTMAMTGSQRAAKQLGITVPAVTTAYDAAKEAAGKHIDATEKLTLAHAKLIDKMATGNAVIDAVRDHVKGQAQAFADTATGGMAQFHANLDSLEVNIGNLLLPAIQKIVVEMNKLIVFIQANMPTIKRVAHDVFTGISVAWETVLKPVLIGIVGSVVLTVQAIIREWPKIRAAAESVVQWYNDNLKPTITAVLEYLRAFWARWGDDITNITKRIFGILWTIVKPLMVVLRDTIEVVLALIRGDWGKAWDSLKDLLKNAFDAYVAMVKGYVSLMFSAAKAVGGAIVDGIVQGIKDAPSVGKALIDKVKGPSGLDLVKSVFGIHSPSDLTARELGEPLAAGIAQGILSGKTSIGDALVQTMQGVLDAAKARVGTQFGEFSSWIEHAFGAAQTAAMARLETRLQRDQAQLTAKVAAAQAKISAFGAAMTPAEKALAALQEEHAQAGRTAAITAAQAHLAGATTPDEAAAAQAELDNALYEQRVADLEKIAATERDARDAETARRQANLDAQTAADQAAFDKRAEQQRAALTEAQWEEQQHFQARLANLASYLESGHATAKGALKKIRGFLDDFGVQAGNAAELLGTSFAKGLRNMIPDIVDAAQAISTALENEGIITQGRKITITIEENAKKAAKKRAMGGPVTKGAPYLVGEIGPELFVPNVSGAILPTSALASAPTYAAGRGDTNVELHVHGNLVHQNDLMRWLRDTIRIGGRDGFIIDQPRPGFQ